MAVKADFPNCLTDATDAHSITCDDPANAGLRRAFSSLVPVRPYCADVLSDGLKIRDRDVALKHRHVQLNGKYLYRWMPHDIDHSDAHNAHRDANLPPPNFIAINPENGHGHCAVLLATPVSRYEASRVEPLRFYSAVERGIARRLGADRYYAGIITKNPLHQHWRVEWRRNKPYRLHELAEWLFFEDMRPDPRPDSIAAGRIFDELRLIAYREVRQFKKDGANLDQWRVHLEMLAPTSINSLSAIAFESLTAAAMLVHYGRAKCAPSPGQSRIGPGGTCRSLVLQQGSRASGSVAMPSDGQDIRNPGCHLD